MTVTVSLRQNQSAALSWSQLDTNFIVLSNAVNTLPTANGGPTASRPTSPALYQIYCDTTLGYPVFCYQTSPDIIWLNAAGIPS